MALNSFYIETNTLNELNAMTKKQNIAIIGTVGLPANYGGFETLAEHLVENLSDEYNMTVYCSGKRYAKASRR